MIWNTNIGMIKMKDKIFNDLIDYSLEDVYNILYRNKPKKNSKLYGKWEFLEYCVRCELLLSDERTHECTELIKEVIAYLKEDWECKQYEENRIEIERQSK